MSVANVLMSFCKKDLSVLQVRKELRLRVGVHGNASNLGYFLSSVVRER